jgi:phenylalanyl-tRNA synthetase beta chain
LPGVIDEYPQTPERPEVTVRLSRAHKILGMAVSQEEARSYLSRLGFEIKAESEGILTAVPPSWRPDILREDDLVEEIGRVHGYEKIPDKLPEGVTTQGGTHGFDAVVEKVEEAALRAGLNQIVSHTLRDRHPLDRAGERTTVRNPSSPDARYLRNSLLPSLADAALRNHEADALHLFEIGHVFSPDEKIDLGILLSGKLTAPHWSAKGRDTADFFALKGVLQYVLETSWLRLELEPPAQADPRFHPTRHALLKREGQTVGVFGQVHPSIAKELGLDGESLFAELSLTDAAFKDLHESPHREISRFPAVRRDIAVVIDKSVPYAKIESAVEGAAGEVLEKQWLFDVYEGKGIAEGQHSLAIALQLRKQGETFTDEEANQVRDSVVKALEGLGGQLR